MNKIALALFAAVSLSLAAPAMAAISGSGSVGQFNQWDSAKLPQHQQPQHQHRPAPQPAKSPAS